jgi:hypothetical protein
MGLSETKKRSLLWRLCLGLRASSFPLRLSTRASDPATEIEKRNAGEASERMSA